MNVRSHTGGGAAHGRLADQVDGQLLNISVDAMQIFTSDVLIRIGRGSPRPRKKGTET